MHVIELFAGAAGLAQGFERTTHYNTAALYDIFEPAQRSYQAHYPQAHYERVDVRDLTADAVLRTLDGRTLHGILGGPPCQGFSLAGKKQTNNDINQLVLAYAHVIHELHPHFLMMENVPQLLYHPLFQPLLDQLERHYYVSYAILNAARYGVPQTRHRLFLVAYRREYDIRPTFPRPSHGRRGQWLYSYYLTQSRSRLKLREQTAEQIFGADPILSNEVRRQVSKANTSIDEHFHPLITVGDAIGDLGNATTSIGQLMAYNRPAQTDYQRSLRGTMTEAPNCVARQHQPSMIELVKSLREGGIPGETHPARNDAYYSQAYGRLHHAGLARTLTTYFQNAGSGRFFHYREPRTLTIREAARLQGFSDDFIFAGTLSDQMQLVGNAVPLPLATALGQHIVNELGSVLPA